MKKTLFKTILLAGVLCTPLANVSLADKEAGMTAASQKKLFSLVPKNGKALFSKATLKTVGNSNGKFLQRSWEVRAAPLKGGTQYGEGIVDDKAKGAAKKKNPANRKKLLSAIGPQFGELVGSPKIGKNAKGAPLLTAEYAVSAKYGNKTRFPKTVTVSWPLKRSCTLSPS